MYHQLLDEDTLSLCLWQLSSISSQTFFWFNPRIYHVTILLALIVIVSQWWQKSFERNRQIIRRTYVFQSRSNREYESSNYAPFLSIQIIYVCTYILYISFKESRNKHYFWAIHIFIASITYFIFLKGYILYNIFKMNTNDMWRTIAYIYPFYTHM